MCLGSPFPGKEIPLLCPSLHSHSSAPSGQRGWRWGQWWLGMELPRDGRDMSDAQGGDMMLSVVWKRAGMGFLEGTGADSSPEGIASLGFARAWLGMAVRELGAGWKGLSCAHVEQSGCQLQPGQYFHAWKSKFR